MALRPTEPVEDKTYQDLQQAWAGMSRRQQRLLWHWTVLGEPAAEVAERVGIPADSIAIQVERARLELGVRMREVQHDRQVKHLGVV